MDKNQICTMTFVGLLPFERISRRSAGDTKKNLGKAICFENINSLSAFSQIVKSTYTFSRVGKTYYCTQKSNAF